MNDKTRWPVLLAIALALLSGGALAKDDDDDDDDSLEKERQRITYSGIGLSRLSTDFDNVKDAVSLDAALGFRVPDVQWFAVELDIGFTLIPGEVERESFDPGTECPITDPFCTPEEPNTTSSQEDFQAFNLGVFAIIRTPGRFYAMGKTGYRYLNTNLPELDDDRSGSAWGLGLGYRYSAAGGFAELGYTKLSDDLKALGFSLGYGFGKKD